MSPGPLPRCRRALEIRVLEVAGDNCHLVLAARNHDPPRSTPRRRSTPDVDWIMTAVRARPNPLTVEEASVGSGMLTRGDSIRREGRLTSEARCRGTNGAQARRNECRLRSGCRDVCRDADTPPARRSSGGNIPAPIRAASISCVQWSSHSELAAASTLSAPPTIMSGVSATDAPLAASRRARRRAFTRRA